jgi:hypothetical protein
VGNFEGSIPEGEQLMRSSKKTGAGTCHFTASKCYVPAYNTPTIYVGRIIDFFEFYEKMRNLAPFFGAGDRFRTDDLVLGKHTLYQLSYTRSPFRPVRTRSFIGRQGYCQFILHSGRG